MLPGVLLLDLVVFPCYQNVYFRPMHYPILRTSRTLNINYYIIIQKLQQTEENYERAKCEISRSIGPNAKIKKDNA